MNNQDVIKVHDILVKVNQNKLNTFDAFYRILEIIEPEKE